MKVLKLISVFALTLLMSLEINAQEVRVYPAYGTVVAKVYKPKVVVHKGVNYFYASGVWYRAHGKRYRVSRAPIGIRVRALPRGVKIAWVNGRKHFVHKGIWYAKRGRFYTVVSV